MDRSSVEKIFERTCSKADTLIIVDGEEYNAFEHIPGSRHGGYWARVLKKFLETRRFVRVVERAIICRFLLILCIPASQPDFRRWKLVPISI